MLSSVTGDYSIQAVPTPAAFARVGDCARPTFLNRLGGNSMKRWLALAPCMFFAVAAVAQKAEIERLEASYETLRDILGMPDKGIPRDLLDKAECVIVVPSMKKAAFIAGASYGRGVMTCRSGENFRGPWSAPAFFAFEGASFGFQVGGEATDYSSW